MSRDVGSPPEVDFASAMGDRYTSEPAAPRQRTTAKTEQPAMTRRSWLLPVDVAEAFAAAAARIHHHSEGAVSKSTAQAALIREALKHESEVVEALANEAPSR